jgi:hypothetical protein
LEFVVEVKLPETVSGWYVVRGDDDDDPDECYATVIFTAGFLIAVMHMSPGEDRDECGQKQ